MKTLEMMNLANENGKTYVSKSMLYEKTLGFRDKDDNVLWPGRAFKYLNDLFELTEWKLVKEPVDFMTAINSDKKIYPVEYFEGADERDLNGNYEDEMDEYIRDAIWSWLGEDVLNTNHLKYINGMWYIEE